MTALDKVLADYRANPSEANKARLLLLQSQQVATFHSRQADSYIARTR